MQLINDELGNGNRVTQQSSFGQLDHSPIYKSAGIQNESGRFHVLRLKLDVGDD